MSSAAESGLVFDGSHETSDLLPKIEEKPDSYTVEEAVAIAQRVFSPDHNPWHELNHHLWQQESPFHPDHKLLTKLLSDFFELGVDLPVVQALLPQLEKRGYLPSEGRTPCLPASVEYVGFAHEVCRFRDHIYRTEDILLPTFLKAGLYGGMSTAEELLSAEAKNLPPDLDPVIVEITEYFEKALEWGKRNKANPAARSNRWFPNDQVGKVWHEIKSIISYWDDAETYTHSDLESFARRYLAHMRLIEPIGLAIQAGGGTAASYKAKSLENYFATFARHQITTAHPEYSSMQADLVLHERKHASITIPSPEEFVAERALWVEKVQLVCKKSDFASPSIFTDAENRIVFLRWAADRKLYPNIAELLSQAYDDVLVALYLSLPESDFAVRDALHNYRSLLVGGMFDFYSRRAEVSLNNAREHFDGVDLFGLVLSESHIPSLLASYGFEPNERRLNSVNFPFGKSYAANSPVQLRLLQLAAFGRIEKTQREALSPVLTELLLNSKLDEKTASIAHTEPALFIPEIPYKLVQSCAQEWSGLDYMYGLREESNIGTLFSGIRLSNFFYAVNIDNQLPLMADIAMGPEIFGEKSPISKPQPFLFPQVIPGQNYQERKLQGYRAHELAYDRHGRVRTMRELTETKEVIVLQTGDLIPRVFHQGITAEQRLAHAPEALEKIKTIVKESPDSTNPRVLQKLQALLESLLGVKIRFEGDGLLESLRFLSRLEEVGARSVDSESSAHLSGLLEKLHSNQSEMGVSDIGLLILLHAILGVIPGDLVTEFAFRSLSQTENVLAAELIATITRLSNGEVGSSDEDRLVEQSAILAAKQQLRIKKEQLCELYGDNYAFLHDPEYQQEIDVALTRILREIARVSRYDLSVGDVSSALWAVNRGNGAKSETALSLRCSASGALMVLVLRSFGDLLPRAISTGYDGVETTLPLQDWLQKLAQTSESGETSHGFATLHRPEGALEVVDLTFKRHWPIKRDDIVSVHSKRSKLIFGRTVLANTGHYSSFPALQMHLADHDGGSQPIADMCVDSAHILLPYARLLSPDSIRVLLSSLRDDSLSVAQRLDALHKILDISPRRLAMRIKDDENSASTLSLLEETIAFANKQRLQVVALYLAEILHNLFSDDAKIAEIGKKLADIQLDQLALLPKHELEAQMTRYSDLLTSSMIDTIWKAWKIRQIQVFKNTEQIQAKHEKSRHWLLGVLSDLSTRLGFLEHVKRRSSAKKGHVAGRERNDDMQVRTAHQRAITRSIPTLSELLGPDWHFTDPEEGTKLLEGALQACTTESQRILFLATLKSLSMQLGAQRFPNHPDKRAALTRATQERIGAISEKLGIALPEEVTVPKRSRLPLLK